MSLFSHHENPFITKKTGSRHITTHTDGDVDTAGKHETGDSNQDEEGQTKKAQIKKQMGSLKASCSHRDSAAAFPFIRKSGLFIFLPELLDSNKELNDLLD